MAQLSVACVGNIQLDISYNQSQEPLLMNSSLQMLLSNYIKRFQQLNSVKFQNLIKSSIKYNQSQRKLLSLLIYKKMKSTLPSLFIKNQIPHYKNNTVVLKKPHRQGGIYDLNLTISHTETQGIQHRYGTKILVVPSDKKKNSLRSKSVMNGSSIYNQNKIKNILNRGQTLSKQNKSLSLSRYMDQSFDSRQKHHNNIEEIDNVRVNCKKLEEQVYFLKVKAIQVTQSHNQLLISIQGLSTKFNKQIQDINENYLNKVNKLYQKLSTIRRETGMEIKLAKKQTRNIAEELHDIKQVAKDIENQQCQIKSINF